MSKEHYGVRERECGGKHKHSTRRAAMSQRVRLKTHGEKRSRPTDVSVYKCSWCGYWHIGHTNRKKRSKA